MRLTRVIVAIMSVLLSASACTSPPKATPGGSVAGTWTLQNYDGHPLPYSAPPENNVINTVTGGELTFSSGGTYTMHVAITHVANGTNASPSDWDEIGTYTLTSDGLTMRPFDVPGTKFRGTPVPVTVDGNTISVPQQGKTLTFAKK